tara:strand:- start:237546 stop:238190 length:645 start_codon:yes stop_codon:yes gene_type:complete
MLFVGGVSAAQAACRYQPVNVRVKQITRPVTLDRSFSAQALTATTGSPVGAGSIVLGHGGGTMQISGGLESYVKGNARDGYCLKVKSVDIEIEILPKIKLANHLRPNTCEYNAVYQHEQFHVAVLGQTMQVAAQQMPSIVNAHLQQLHSNLSNGGGDPQYMNARLQAEFSRTLSTINNQMSAHMNGEQNKIDNPTEYARVQNSCAFESETRTLR